MYSTHPMLLLVGMLVLNSTQAQSQNPSGPMASKPAVTFEENAGQVKDQHWQPRPDVLFKGRSEGLDFFIRNNGISYQFARVLRRKDLRNEEPELQGPHPSGKGAQIPDSLATYRVDVNWLEAQPARAVEQGAPLPGCTNYYDVALGQEPALGVHQYQRVNLCGIWSGVDVEYYSRDGVLESDWLMQDPADHRKIRFEVKGAELRIDPDGYLVMTTPFGEIREGRIQADQRGRPVDVRWVLDGDVVSMEVPHYEAGVPLRIDPPTRVWGTYVGSTGEEYGWDLDVDGAGGVYMSGTTASLSNMATIGAHQTNHGGGITSAFLCRFNAAGTRLWATYYGGPGEDYGYACSRSPNGDIHLAGQTGSDVIMATPGTHQTSLNSPTDGFLVRFNSNSVRLWGTYFGGLATETLWGCAADPWGAVFVAGHTTSPDLIASTNAHQTTFGGGSNNDALLAKFDANGHRIWSTYLGSTQEDKGLSCSVDQLGAVYVAGKTGSNTMIASPGAFQGQQAGGGSDAFLAKFDSSGTRLWGTYFGGNGYDARGVCSTDTLGNVFLVGYTNSDSAIATAGSHQPNIAGGGETFVVKFDESGQRQWATYYGGINEDEPYACHADGTGSVVLTGLTQSTTGIATAGAHDQTYGGVYDAYLAKFNSDGVLHWGTYYGGTQQDWGYSCIADRGNFVYLCGFTMSTTSIASSGAFDTSFSGGINDMFLAKMDGCDPFPVSIAATATSICEEDTVSLIASGALSYRWSPSPSLLTLTGDSVMATPQVTTTYSVTGMDQWGCEAQASKVISVLVIDTTVNLIGNTLIALQGSAQYQWVDCNNAFAALPGEIALLFTPTLNGSYAAIIDRSGCVDTTSCWTVLVTGMEQVAIEPFRVFPNPTSDVLFYQFTGQAPVTLRLIDAVGRVVRTLSTGGASQGNIDVCGMPDGLYLIEFEEGQQQRIPVVKITD